MPSIQSTVRPDEKLTLNEWFNFIHKVEQPKNTVKPGGLSYKENQVEFLNQCKHILENDRFQR